MWGPWDGGCSMFAFVYTCVRNWRQVLDVPPVFLTRFIRSAALREDKTTVVLVSVHRRIQKQKYSTHPGPHIFYLDPRSHLEIPMY